MYKLFGNKNCEWLFAVILRDNYLAQFFKKNNEVISIFNELFVGIIYNLY